MKRLLILLISIGIALSQSADYDESDILDAPDAIQYLDELFDQLFQSFSITTADSLALYVHGYSPRATSTILEWQELHENERSFSSLRRKLEGNDKILLDDDIEKETWQTQTYFRQRMQYSESLSGWRILNKGRVRSVWGDFHVIAEQDPGEAQLTDHKALSFFTTTVPGFDHMIIGDFHVSLGKGMVLNQQGSRMNLNPGSLNGNNLISIRPHYSSREVDFFRGIAGGFTRENLSAFLFLSRRIATGSGAGSAFIEDADGMHPLGKDLQHQMLTHAGMAWESSLRIIRLFGATLFDPSDERLFSQEFGISAKLGETHLLQLHADGLIPNDSRMIFGWTYSTKPMVLAIQHRRFRSMRELESGHLFTRLGSSATNEEGISARFQLRPTKGLQIRYALENALSIQLFSLGDLRSIQEHRIQLIRRLNTGSIQLDISNKRESPAIQGNVWNDQFIQTATNKGALSFVRRYPSQLDYRVNLKVAFENAQSGFLVQQRLIQDVGKWRWSLGYVRFFISDYKVRLSIYESGLAESFSFYTAYDDGERWFIYLKHQVLSYLEMELKISQTSTFNNADEAKQLAWGFQLSIVL